MFKTFFLKKPKIIPHDIEINNIVMDIKNNNNLTVIQLQYLQKINKDNLVLLIQLLNKDKLINILKLLNFCNTINIDQIKMDSEEIQKNKEQNEENRENILKILKFCNTINIDKITNDMEYTINNKIKLEKNMEYLEIC